MSTTFRLFNSGIEFATRTAVLLSELYPTSFDIDELVFLNYLIVHTGDLDGPASLHPPLADRKGELLVTRTVLQEAVAILRLSHNAEVIHGPAGVVYRGSDSAYAFVSLLSSPYATQLIANARWIGRMLESSGIEQLRAKLAERVGQWTPQFDESGQ